MPVIFGLCISIMMAGVIFGCGVVYGRTTKHKIKDGEEFIVIRKRREK